MTDTNENPFPNEDRSEFCSECEQHFACNDCTPEQCNCPGNEDEDNFRPRDMGRHCDWNISDFYRWQNEVE